MSTVSLTVQNELPWFQDFNWLEHPIGLRGLVLNPTAKVLDWTRIINGSLPEHSVEARRLIGHTNLALNWIELPKRVEKLIDSFAILNVPSSIGKKSKQAITAYSNLMGVTTLTISSIETFYKQYFSSLPASLEIIRSRIVMLGSLALILKSSIDIQQIFNDLYDEQKFSSKFNTALFNLAIKICTFAIGVLRIAIFIFGGGVMAQYMFLSVLSLSLAFSISKYYLTTESTDRFNAKTRRKIL